jgi:DNA repair protein RecO (recombination protein O)
MQWTDEALILSVRPHGETAAVVELFALRHGRHVGFVHGGRSRRLRPVLQIGNHVDVTWKGRLPEQLGHFSLELRRGHAAQSMSEPLALAGLAAMAGLLRMLPERDPHPNLYELTMFVLSYLDDESVWPALYARWELALLDELGFGLDLAACAATGAGEGLIYVSPKSGRAVSAAAGEPYRDRLLPLPAFLKGGAQGAVTRADVALAMDLTGHFLNERALLPRGLAMPEARSRLAELMRRPVTGPRSE